jgi:hypothetical protein
MPILAWAKRRTARLRNNRALAVDAVQSATCAYLAAVTLGGLAINAIWHIHWVDSVAGTPGVAHPRSRGGALYAVRAVVAAEIRDSSTDSKILQPLSSPP